MIEFHFYSRSDDYFDAWLTGAPEDFFPDYDGTSQAFIRDNSILPDRIVHTLQMSFLTQAWDLHFEYGARVFIHDHTGTYEVLEGDKCERTDRYLRRAHNLFKLWRAGEFWKIEEDK